MQYTLRSAFKRWLILHNEEWRAKNGCVRIPHWFRHYIRKNTNWKYKLTFSSDEEHCNRCELDYNARRRYKGHYVIEISDEELLSLQRAEWIK